jgi:hypothetical protein
MCVERTAKSNTYNVSFAAQIAVFEGGRVAWADAGTRTRFVSREGGRLPRVPKTIRPRFCRRHGYQPLRPLRALSASKLAGVLLAAHEAIAVVLTVGTASQSGFPSARPSPALTIDGPTRTSGARRDQKIRSEEKGDPLTPSGLRASPKHAPMAASGSRSCNAARRRLHGVRFARIRRGLCRRRS